MKSAMCKAGFLVLAVALAGCQSPAGQGVSQAAQGILQAGLAGGTADQAGAGASQAGAAGQGGLAQVAAGMLSQGMGAQPAGGTSGAAPATGPQPAPALANSSEAGFFGRSGLQACGGGALATVLTCKVTKSCDSDKSAIKAAVLGCGIGIGVNYYLEYQRSQYGDAEQRLDALIGDVQADNQKLQSLNEQARQVLADDTAALTSIQQGLRNKTVQKAQAEARIAQIDANTHYLNSTLASLKTRQQQWQDVANTERGQGSRVEALDAEIGRMQKQIVTLQQGVDNVARQRAGVILG